MAIHREEFLFLPHVSHDRALIAWGAFFFAPDDGKHELIEHEDLAEAVGRRRGSIGAEADSYGSASVRITPLAGGATQEVGAPAGQNHVWITGLRPDTAYRYEVLVDGKPWGANPHDFDRPGGRKGHLTPAQWRYRN